MKIKRIAGRVNNPITFFPEGADEKLIKLALDEEKEVSDVAGYQILGKYPGEVIKIDEDRKEPAIKRKINLKRETKIIDSDYENKGV